MPAPNIMENQEKLDWLYQEIRKLPAVERSLALLYLDAKSYQEIAEILGISVRTLYRKIKAYGLDDLSDSKTESGS